LRAFEALSAKQQKSTTITSKVRLFPLTFGNNGGLEPISSLKFSKQWTEQGLALAPAAYRTPISRSTDMHGARRPYRSFCPVEVEATRVTFEAATLNEMSCYAFKIRSQILIPHVDDAAGRKYAVRMHHQFR
jgi:hypothetical protein